MWCIKRGQFDWKKELRIALENIYDVAPATSRLNMKLYNTIKINNHSYYINDEDGDSCYLE